MELLFREQVNGRDTTYIQYEVKLNEGKVVYLNVSEEEITNKVPYNDAEVYIYTRSFSDIVGEPTEEDYYDCSEEEAKEIYDFCLDK